MSLLILLMYKLLDLVLMSIISNALDCALHWTSPNRRKYVLRRIACMEYVRPKIYISTNQIKFQFQLGLHFLLIMWKLIRVLISGQAKETQAETVFRVNLILILRAYWIDEIENKIELKQSRQATLNLLLKSTG